MDFPNEYYKASLLRMAEKREKRGEKGFLEYTQKHIQNYEDVINTAKDADYIFNLLLHIPPKLNQCRKALESFHLPSIAVSNIAYEYIEKCWEEDIEVEDKYPEDYLSWCWRDSEIIDGKHSTYLCKVLELLLKYGLDPSYCYFENSSGPFLLEKICHIVNGYVASDSLCLLLENGGDPNMYMDGETLFDNIDFTVGFDAANQYDRRRYDSLIHCWMVLIGFGGKPANGSTPLDTFDEYNPFQGEVPFDVTKLKNHRNYTFGITYDSNRGSTPTIHIFDKRTFWEVARI